MQPVINNQHSCDSATTDTRKCFSLRRFRVFCLPKLRFIRLKFLQILLYLLRSFSHIHAVFHLVPCLFQFFGNTLDFTLEFCHPGLVMLTG